LPERQGAGSITIEVGEDRGTGAIDDFLGLIEQVARPVEVRRLVGRSRRDE
jgi:hypothetical protein